MALAWWWHPSQRTGIALGTRLTKWRHQPYFEEEAPTYCCYFGQVYISKAKIRENSPKIHGYTERGINRAGLV
jgi:hypothetical protein